MSSRDAGDAMRIVVMTVTLPVAMPSSIAALLETKKLSPAKLFDVFLTDEAIDEYHLDAWTVFAIDLADSGSTRSGSPARSRSPKRG